MQHRISGWSSLAAACGLSALVGCASNDTGAPVAPFACLAPPSLTGPLTFVNACPGDSGFPTVVEADGRDVFIRLPKDRVCQRGLSVNGAGNVWIQGGAFLYTESGKAVISISRTSGTSFIEGLGIDVAGKSADAIRVYRNTGRLIVQNTFARRISGQPAGIHGDLVHAQGDGPLQELVLQNVTGYTGYQGLFTPYRPESGHGARAVRLERVNVAYDPALNRNAGAGKPLMLLFMGSADNTWDRVPDLGTTLSSVYVDGSYWSFPYYKAIYAYPSGTANCTSFDAKHKISGQICGGKPTDYAPAGQVGASYNRANFCY